MRYEQYVHRDIYKGVPNTFGAFAIVKQPHESSVGVLIKQRNGKGGSPFLFDLPGGRVEAGESLPEAACRELKEEVGLSALPDSCVAIGGPLWLPVYRDGNLERVDCAQAFLVEVGSELPTPTEEAINIATVSESSAAGFSLVGFKRDPDPEKCLFGRTPVMIWDGLSVIRPPALRLDYASERQREDLHKRLGVVPSEDIYLPVDNGNYLSRTRQGVIELYYRLNPFQPDGRFHGTLEDLISG